MKARIGNLEQRQRGQTLVLFTLLFTVIIGFLALAIDLGFLFGQRRWDQDGADAGAMTSAYDIAGSVVPLSSGGIYIASTDCHVYLLARQYGGVSQNSSCGSNMTSTPSGVNQNSSLDGSNKVAVVVEYCDGTTSCDPGTKADWCFSPASITALPTGTLANGNLPRTGESDCTSKLYNGSYLPQPGSDAYKVRVTVSTVTTSSFAQAIVPGGNLGPAVSPTSPQTSATGPACVRPGNASGMLACSQAIATINGVANVNGNGPIVPFVANDCNIGGDTISQELTQLWTNNPPPNCTGQNTNGSWKGIIDLTWETQWCPNYNYQVALPDPSVGSQPWSSYSGSQVYPCSNNPTIPDQGGSEHGWDRVGYSPDQSGMAPLAPSYGSDDSVGDVQFWASQGFGGSIHASYTDGNYFPTYCDPAGGPGCGNHGNNIAQAFYCQTGSVTSGGEGCSISGNNQVTYFFQWSKLRFGNGCKLPNGSYPDNTVGCRDAGVPTWENPQTWKSNNWKANGTPDRVQIVRILQMRLYCQIGGDGYCTDPPSSVTGNSSNSEVWGYFVSDTLNLCPPAPASCTGGLSIIENVPSLSG